jgi:hypothetical protein
VLLDGVSVAGGIWISSILYECICGGEGKIVYSSSEVKMKIHSKKCWSPESHARITAAAYCR